MFGNVDVAVVPKGAHLVGDEAIGEAFARLDRLLRHIGHAVAAPAVGLVHAVPVNGMTEGRVVGHRDLDIVPFLHPQQRARDLPVVGPDLVFQARCDIDGYFLDRHVEMAGLGPGPGGQQPPQRQGKDEQS